MLGTEVSSQDPTGVFTSLNTNLLGYASLRTPVSCTLVVGKTFRAEDA